MCVGRVTKYRASKSGIGGALGGEDGLQMGRASGSPKNRLVNLMLNRERLQRPRANFLHRQSKRIGRRIRSWQRVGLDTRHTMATRNRNERDRKNRWDDFFHAQVSLR